MNILKYERKYELEGYNRIIGIDEAGRGPLAGPVVAAAVCWGDADIIDGIKDSKKISEKKRLLLYDLIQQNAQDIAIGVVHENEIDEINILQSTFLAMRKAIGALKNKPDMILIDGNSTDIANLLEVIAGAAGSSQTNYGYTSGGQYQNSPFPYRNTIQKFSFTTDGNSVDVGDLTASLVGGAGCQI